MARLRAAVRLSFGLAAFVLAAGCGSRTTTVKGVVRFQGQPVPSGSVILYCSDKQIVRGTLDSEGRFEIANVPYGRVTITVQSHSKSPSGLKSKQRLPPSINSPVPPAVEADNVRFVPIPARYSHPEESGISRTIDQANTTLTIDLNP